MRVGPLWPPLRRLEYQAEDARPSSTAPTRFAEGAVKAAPETVGTAPACLTTAHGSGSFSRHARSPWAETPSWSTMRPTDRTAVPTAYQKDAGPGGRDDHARYARCTGVSDIPNPPLLQFCGVLTHSLYVWV